MALCPWAAAPSCPAGGRGGVGLAAVHLLAHDGQQVIPGEGFGQQPVEAPVPLAVEGGRAVGGDDDYPGVPGQIL